MLDSIIGFCLFLFLLYIIFKLRFVNNEKTVHVVVLGDVGRSPRMQYHSSSLAREGYQVYLLGYSGSAPHECVLNDPLIKISSIHEPPALLKKLPKSVVLLMKFAWLGLCLLWRMCLLPRPSHILLQNPPSLPTMLVCVVMGGVRGAMVVIDWHNYGHTILALSFKPDSPVVKIYKQMEMGLGRMCAKHLCVTKAMREDLWTNHGIKATTLHDRPSDRFKILNDTQKHKFFSQFSPLFDANKIGVSTMSSAEGGAHLLDDRPALVVSSTSWTPDEDFEVLFKALDNYNDSASIEGSKLPSVVCIVTGKGPLKEHYTKLISQKDWSKVRVLTVWLPADQYPLLLGSCDVGVSLHWSSSGLDLPMKVVDMFGCALPVCSIKYPCIGELVENGQNGLLFEDHHQLHQQLKDLLRGFPGGDGRLVGMRKCLKEKRSSWNWHDNWKDSALKIFMEFD